MDMKQIWRQVTQRWQQWRKWRWKQGRKQREVPKKSPGPQRRGYLPPENLPAEFQNALDGIDNKPERPEPQAPAKESPPPLRPDEVAAEIGEPQPEPTSRPLKEDEVRAAMSRLPPATEKDEEPFIAPEQQEEAVRESAQQLPPATEKWPEDVPSPIAPKEKEEVRESVKEIPSAADKWPTEGFPAPPEREQVRESVEQLPPAAEKWPEDQRELPEKTEEAVRESARELPPATGRWPTEKLEVSENTRWLTGFPDEEERETEERGPQRPVRDTLDETARQGRARRQDFAEVGLEFPPPRPTGEEFPPTAEGPKATPGRAEEGSERMIALLTEIAQTQEQQLEATKETTVAVEQLMEALSKVGTYTE